MINVNLTRENSKYPLRIKLQKGSKIKDASWWLIVGDPAEDKVLCHKKVYFKDKARKKMQICLPEDFKKSQELVVYLMSDSYIGLDQIYTLRIGKD